MIGKVGRLGFPCSFRVRPALFYYKPRRGIPVPEQSMPRKGSLTRIFDGGLAQMGHYTHAVESRMMLLRELSRARSRNLAVPGWLIRDVLRNPGIAEDLVHLLRFFRPEDRLRLVDVGANTGYWADEFLRLFPDTCVTAIEPIPGTAARLRERFSGDARVTVVNAAVTPQPSPIEMTEARESTLSSLHAYADSLTNPDAEGNRIQVNGMRLDDLDIPNDGRTLFLKLDTQGHEVPALTTGKSFLQRVNVAIVEVSFVEEYAGVPPSFGRCVALFAEADLHPVIFQDFGRNLSPYAYERDVIFARSELLKNILGY